jgi:His/Glu/Gln/Arg/opine family amino acid ABC transporter permease subunit
MIETDFARTDLWFMLRGAGMTLALTFWAVLGGTVMGFVFGVLRVVASSWINAMLGAVLDVFRSIPLLIQFILANSLKSIVGLDISAFTVACVVLAIYTSAYCAEIVRAGVLAVPTTTRRAARVAAVLGRSHARRDEGHLPGLVDRARRTAARIAGHRHPHPGATAGADAVRTDLLPDELPDLALRRVPRNQVARP